MEQNLVVGNEIPTSSPQATQLVNPQPEISLPPSSSKKKIITIGVITIIVMFGIIAGAFVIYKTLKTENLNKDELIKDTSKTQEKPNVEIKIAEQKLFNLKGKFSIEYQTNTPKPFGFSIDFEQAIDLTDLRNPKSLGSFESRFSSNLDPPEMFIKGQNKQFGKIDYFRITDFSSPALFFGYILPSTSKKDLTEVKNQWIEVDELIWHRLQKDNGFWGPSLLPEEITTTVEVIQRIFDNSTFVERYKDEKFEDIEAYHYVISLNREQGENLLREIFYVENPEDYRRDEKDKNLQKIIDDFYGRAEEIKSEVWVGKNDGLVYKAKIDVQLNDLPSNQNSEESAIISRFSLDLNFYNFGNSSNFSIPDSPKKLEDLSPFKSTWGFKNISDRRDAQRIDDIWEIWKIFTSYRKEKGAFPQMEKIPIGLLELDPFPIDPGGGPCPGPYQWISNLGEPQKIVLYTCLENGKFYMFYESGGKPMDNRPTGLNTR